MQSGKGLVILAACLCLVMTEARRKLKRHDIEEEKSTEEFDEEYDDVCSIRYMKFLCFPFLIITIYEHVALMRNRHRHVTIHLRKAFKTQL